MKKYKNKTKFATENNSLKCLVSPIIIILSLLFILLIQGAIPFISMPTLGQAIWTMGFSQSLANQSVIDLYAINFGNPEPAPMYFGLAGAYLASLFVRAGIHPADAYTLMMVLWLSVAFFGAWKISKALNLSLIFSALVSVLWLSMPIIWQHASYSMLSLGISLLPFYFYASLRLFCCFNSADCQTIRMIILYLSTTIISIFMDGYSFMMFATGSSIIGGYTFLSRPEIRSKLLKFGFPVHFLGFGLAYFLYSFYIGKAQFNASPLDFFRGWGVDLMFLAIPSQGIQWFWDAIGVGIARNGNEQFGDASVWTTTFALPVVIFGILSWWLVHKDFKIATGILLVSLFGFYMAMGPSIKFDSVKPKGVSQRSMAQDYAIAPTGNALLSEHVPGFKNMRAAYRWTALGLLGLWLLIALLMAREKSVQMNWFAVGVIIFLIVSNLPNLNKKIVKNIDFRNDFTDIEEFLVLDLKKALNESEMVAFLPFRNDFFVNYLASRVNIRTFNIGGDKNLAEAIKHWPKTMRKFKAGRIDKDFSYNLHLLLERGEADAIILPYIDLLWAAHSWPAPLKYKKQLESIIADLQLSSKIWVDERQFYAIMRLVKK